MGLSPHTRGKLQCVVTLAPLLGPIPAYAGETSGARTEHLAAGAYPRIRGGNFVKSTARRSDRGLSPHTRGKHSRCGHSNRLIGPIPAYAGETKKTPLTQGPRRAYPRIRGGNIELAYHFRKDLGLSPHTRGKQSHRKGFRVGCGPIPAYAGETPPPRRRQMNIRAYPRIRGGNAYQSANTER